MRVVINGGGIGGLTLAQALRDHADVTVIERDADAVATGGYRLALNSAATGVLTRHVAPEIMARIRAVSDDARRFAQFTIATDRMKPLDRRTAGSPARTACWRSAGRCGFC